MEGPSDSGRVRASHADRTEAQQLLGDHLDAGRLNSDEYGQRTAAASCARTRGEIQALFRELPDPRPRFGAPGTQAFSPVKASPRGEVAAAVQDDQLVRHLRYGAISVMVPCAVFGAGVGLVEFGGEPAVLLLAAVTIAVIYGVLAFVGYFKRR
ncbi:DUF1707 domain-containing protein [Saccharopolyspora sp. NFXS83]|uniref:DUF1707 SHOCT-like domain-containing protein n=1 Tax=Saccharopolyspora sp. NFXS83 TaxID=2993560 RepID=UPI00224B082C|nr:DUF1707 domain-containing protein [Saccharopolyspora sp. NFXS83]MCX2729155.1 DUF1707 domain-containing protein [Saccharopolyspora sp. NFXS83]